MLPSLLILLISLQMYLCKGEFDRLRHIKSFSPALYKSHSHWILAIEELIFLIRSYKIYSVLTGDTKAFHSSDVEDYFPQFKRYKFGISTLAKNIPQYLHKKITTIYIEKWSPLTEGTRLFTFDNNFEITNKMDDEIVISKQPCFVSQIYIRDEMTVGQFEFEYACFGSEIMQSELSPHTKKALETSINRLETFTSKNNYKSILLDNFTQSFASESGHEITLSYLDTSFRLASLKTAKRYESEPVQRKVFWTTYERLWQTIFPFSKLLSPDDIVPVKEKTFVVSVPGHSFRIDPNPDELPLFHNLTRFDFAQRFPMEKIMKSIVLGPFAQDPLTWPCQHSPKAAKKAFPLVWHSAILAIKIPKTSEKIRQLPRPYLLDIREHNDVMTGWTDGYMKSASKMAVYKKPLRSSRVTAAEIRVREAAIQNPKWLNVHVSQSDSAFGLLFCRPIMLYSITEPYYTQTLPSQPHRIYTLPPRSTIYKTTNLNTKELLANEILYSYTQNT